MSEDLDFSSRRSRYTALGVALGLCLGGALGVVLWQANDDFIWFILFSGAGLVLGSAIGAAIGSSNPKQ